MILPFPQEKCKKSFRQLCEELTERLDKLTWPHMCPNKRMDAIRVKNGERCKYCGKGE